MIAAGSWSPIVAKMLGVNLLIQAGKGYSMNVYRKTNINYPNILTDVNTAVTPMDGFTRFGGTMEITSIRDFKINEKRLEGIVERINQFYPTMKVSKPEIQDVWFGFRPCSPNGLPIIEKSIKIKNLIFATGHAMMGVSLAPATGKLVSELVLGNKTSIDITAFAKG